MSARNSVIPASTIKGRLSINAVMIPSMISGRTVTMVSMISGKASTNAVRSCIPASTIYGIAETMYSTIAVISSGRASIN